MGKNKAKILGCDLALGFQVSWQHQVSGNHREWSFRFHCKCPVHFGEKFRVQGHEEKGSNHCIIQIESCQAQTQRSITGQKEPQRIHHWLLFLLIEHDSSSCCGTSHNLHKSSKWMETGDIPKVWMRRFFCESSTTIEFPGLWVGEFLKQWEGGQNDQEFLQTILGQPGNLWQNCWHGEIGKG